MKLLLLTALVLAPSALVSTHSFAAGNSFRSTSTGTGGGSSSVDPDKPTTGTTSISTTVVDPVGSGSSTTSTTSVSTTSVTTAGVRPTRPVIVEREDILKAIDAALNSEDVEIPSEQGLINIRPQTFDLKSGLLRGKNLETNKSIILMDRSKMMAE